MLRIYDEEVFVIDLDEFKTNARQVLENMAENPDWAKMVLLIKKAGEVIAAASFLDFLKNNIILKMFSNNSSEGGYFQK